MFTLYQQFSMHKKCQQSAVSSNAATGMVIPPYRGATNTQSAYELPCAPCGAAVARMPPAGLLSPVVRVRFLLHHLHSGSI